MEQLKNALDNVHYLSRIEVQFMASLGTPEKPMTVKEFIPYWNSLSMEEQTDLLLHFVGTL
jgi:hypothetical protein